MKGLFFFALVQKYSNANLSETHRFRNTEKTMDIANIVYQTYIFKTTVTLESNGMVFPLELNNELCEW